MTNKNQRRLIKRKITLNLEIPSSPISFALCFLISPEWNLHPFHPHMQHHSHYTEGDGLQVLHIVPQKLILAGEQAGLVVVSQSVPGLYFPFSKFLILMPPSF